MIIIEDNDERIIYELDRKDRPFDWFLNIYKGSKIDGKLVFMDVKMLLRILNSRKCFIDKQKTIDCQDGMDQEFEVRWVELDNPIAKATICVHGPNKVYIDSSDGFANYNIRDDARNWIYFKDVSFVSQYKGSYESRMLEEFEYGKNISDDDQFIFLVYKYQQSLKLKKQHEEIMKLKNPQMGEE